MVIDRLQSSVRDTLEQVDVAKRMIQQYSSTLHFCKESSCVRKAFRRGRIASMLAIEGGHQVGNSIASIRQFYDLGVRYITTTHNCDNAFATSASTVAKGSEDNGLSRFGYEYVKEMNRIGMMVDLSHVSHQTMRDVLSVTRAPVIFSHSGAYSVQKHLRHVPDDVLRNVQRNGGIVMVTFINRFLNMEDPDAANIGDVVDHVFHIARVAGWESVGVGGDYSGTPDTPVGLEVCLATHHSCTFETCTDMFHRTSPNTPSWSLPSSPEAQQTSKLGSLPARISSASGKPWKIQRLGSKLKTRAIHFPARLYGRDGSGRKDIPGCHFCFPGRSGGSTGESRQRGQRLVILASRHELAYGREREPVIHDL